MTMTDFADDLFLGRLSRRLFLERLSGAGAGMSLLAATFPAEVAECQEAPARPPRPDDDEAVRYSPDNIGGGGRIERNFYREWLRKSRVPRVDVINVRDARTQEVQPWPEIGGRGVYVNFTGNVHMDTVLVEIPEGKALLPRRHAYEQLIHVVSGRGHTEVGEGNARQAVSWGEGSLFTVPLNAPHRHVNEDAARPARLMLVTTFPFMMQVFGSLGMIQDLRHDFTERFSGQPDYYTKNEQIHKRWWRINVVKDLRDTAVVAWEERGRGNASMFWDMGGNTILEPHVSQFPVNTYKLGHRHPYEAIILTLNGKGFSLAGKDGLAERHHPVKIDWQAGSIVSPPYFWYHQHFNTGDAKARYWAITEGDFPKRLGIPLEVEQIEADREDPGIRRLFEKELGRPRASEAHPNPGLHHHEMHARGIPHRHVQPGHAHEKGE
jgi:quercetin dioxygenase-like cupin family protein